MCSCCFIGHRDCPNELYQELLESTRMLIMNKDVRVFYVGTEGKFSKFAYRALKELEKEYCIETFVVLAYLRKDMDLDKYDLGKTIFPDVLDNTPLRLAIRKRNSYMIDKVEYVITYLDSPGTNTVKMVREALKKRKQVINLGRYNPTI